MLKAFLRATLVWALTAAILPALFLPISILSSSPAENAVKMAGGAVLIILAGSLAFALFSMLLLAIPVALLLRRAGRESEAAYRWSGAVIGFLLPLAIIALSRYGATPMMALIGGISGATAARSWWRHGRKAAVENGSQVGFTGTAAR
ncbi:hypothetical protein ACFB49_09320 [Sphingomonas sp. DBB INV C78]|uniref:hypothetical protein n=1 Tax=Sphingomonas sp. DBB INV C78 TaxID=3349434 RepID=UPI0036D39B47